MPPGFLLPARSSFETKEMGGFRFDIEPSAPLVGLIVAYKGALKPDKIAGRKVNSLHSIRTIEWK